MSSTELQKASSAYDERLKAGQAPEQTMFSLSWDIEELKTLSTEGRTLRTDIAAALDICSPDTFQCHNLPRKLVSIRKRLHDFVKRVVHFRWKPATHGFVFMISSALRNQKPYALPVQCLPYAGLKESDIRRLVSALVRKMISCGMEVSGKAPLPVTLYCLYIHTLYYVGFVSNGEFNYLRTKGYTRQLSVLQIRTDVRNKCSKIRHDVLRAMLTPKRKFLLVQYTFDLFHKISPLHL